MPGKKERVSTCVGVAAVPQKLPDVLPQVAVEGLLVPGLVQQGADPVPQLQVLPIQVCRPPQVSELAALLV